MEAVCENCKRNLVNQTDKDVMEDLITNAVKLNHEQCLHVLIVSGADVNKMQKAVLHAAEGREACLKLLIDAGADVNKCFYFKKTALMLAVEGGHHKCVELLIGAGADVNSHDQDGGTALITAAWRGYDACVNVLTEAGADVNIHDSIDKSALMYAAENGYNVCVKILVKAGANVNSRSDRIHGCTALMFASRGGHDQCVEALIEAGACVNLLATNSWNALFFAAAKDSENTMNLLIKEGSRVNHTDKETGLTALVMSAISGRKASLTTLIRVGADVNKKNIDGETALMLAVRYKKLISAEVLLQAGADVNIKDLDGKTALDVAKECGHDAFVALFMEKATFIDEMGEAIKEDGEKRLGEVLKKGADVNQANCWDSNADEMTPAMFAALKGSKKCLETLIKAGADVNQESGDNEHTPWTIAAASGQAA